MDRKKTERKIRIILFAVYFLLFVIQLLFLAFGMSHNDMELLTVSLSFFEAVLVILLIDVPLFLFIAIFVSAIKELCIYYASGKEERLRLRLSAVSAILAILTVMLFFATNNTVSTALNEVLYLLTLLFACASATVFAIYLIKNRKN